eukprot:gb/GFBE01004165.1/.p1 GENE.gb/GFBE01004165.1/~~gb/GFBE01004165.1/.p1  ORF type:complete len:186 (+),score=41.51 gb/GFBE01004165.1/:1-558(+)
MEVQLEVLRPQLELARTLQRPVSLHCVASHGALLEALQQTFGKGGHAPGLVLHSYCGSAEMVQPFAKLNCFFSFSGSFLHIPKHAVALRAVPLERLLLETDSPDQLPKQLLENKESVRFDDAGPLNEPGVLPLILDGAARAREADLEELAAATSANARRVFDKRSSSAEMAEAAANSAADGQHPT